MLFVKEVLRRKGNAVTAVAPTQSVFSMLETMTRHNIGAVVVMEGDRLLGLVTERDYARNVVLQGRSSKDTPVAEIMVRDPACVSPSHRVRDCMELMTEQRVRHLPVIDGEKLVGIISIGDVVKTIMDEQEALIHNLEEYIAPGR